MTLCSALTEPHIGMSAPQLCHPLKWLLSRFSHSDHRFNLNTGSCRMHRPSWCLYCDSPTLHPSMLSWVHYVHMISLSFNRVCNFWLKQFEMLLAVCLQCFSAGSTCIFPNSSSGVFLICFLYSCLYKGPWLGEVGGSRQKSLNDWSH